jgi:hypothetical protein
MFIITTTAAYPWNNNDETVANTLCHGNVHILTDSSSLFFKIVGLFCILLVFKNNLSISF